MSFKIRKSVSVNKLPKSLQICIERIVKKENFATYDVECTWVSNPGGNYMGDLYEIDIKINSNSTGKEINIFAKVSGGEQLSGVSTSSEAFLQEGYVYKELFKMFAQIQEIVNVPTEKRFKMIKGYDDSSADVMVMDNWAKKGYYMPHRLKVVTLKFEKLAVQELAKLHSLGFVVEKLMPEFYTEFTNKVKLYDHGEGFAKFYKSCAKLSLPSLSDPYKKKAERNIDNCYQIYVKNILDDNTIHTLCHHDYRHTNTLAKTTDGVVTDVIPVDYQTLSVGCPVNDLLCLIYSSTDREFRRKHLKDLYELYYNTMKDFLKHFNLNVADVYPKTVFDSALEQRKSHGFAIAIAFYFFMFAPEDNLPTLNSDLESLNIKLDRDIVERIEEIIDEVEEIGLLEIK